MPNNNRVESSFEASGIQLELYRYPRYSDERLRAWDAADEYILNFLDEQQLFNEGSKALVINDSYGSLSLGLLRKNLKIKTITDSANSRNAIKSNAETNDLDSDAVEIISSIEFSEQNQDSAFDLILIKVPKSLAQLEDILRRIHSGTSENSVVIAAGMAKNIHNSTLELFETLVGPTKTSLARKKARLIFPEIAKQTESIKPLPAASFIVDKEVSKTQKPLYIASYPGVFSHSKLDLGTRYLLECMDIPESANDILDLGCGNGILGLAAALRQPDANITFVDDSCISTESTKESIKLSLAEGHAAQCQVIATHCLQGIDDDSQDLILNNPPFHDAGAQTSAIALEMFQESKRVLRKGGTLLVVANAHLGYHKRLKEIFGRSDLVARNNKFVVLKAIRWR